MIAALAQLALPDPVDFDAMAHQIAGCDRPAVTAMIAAQAKRHSQFLIDAYKEQRAIAVARADVAERRRLLRAKETKGDSEAAVTQAADAVDERVHALADARALDSSEQDMLGYFRTQYLRQCSGKAL